MEYNLIPSQKFDFPIQPVFRVQTLNTCNIFGKNKPYFFRGEFHPFWEMVYVLDGQLAAAGDNRIYYLQKGSAVFYKPMEFHRVWSLDDASCSALAVGFRAEGSGIQTLEAGAFALSGEQQTLLSGLVAYLKQYFPNPPGKTNVNMIRNGADHPERIQNFVNHFELFLLSLLDQQPLIPAQESSEDRDIRLYSRIVEVLNANLTSWVTLDDLAHMLGYGKSHIKHVFSKFSDIGIHKYLLKLKIAAAIRMLESGMTSGEISRQLAFSNQNYFSSVFKRETGLSPTEFKRGAAK